MSLEVKLNWTPNQWRQFFGQADVIPIIELWSVMIDRVMSAAIDRHLAGLEMEHEAKGRMTASDQSHRSFDIGKSGHGRRSAHG